MTYRCPACAGAWSLHAPPTPEQLQIIGAHMVKQHGAWSAIADAELVDESTHALERIKPRG